VHSKNQFLDMFLDKLFANILFQILCSLVEFLLKLSVLTHCACDRVLRVVHLGLQLLGVTDRP